MQNDEQTAQGVLKEAERHMTNLYGYWVFWPVEAGAWNAESLRIIADELERRNKENNDGQS